MIQRTIIINNIDASTQARTKVLCMKFLIWFIYRCDQLLSFYRTDVKTVRWYKRVFYHLAIDVTLTNAFLIYRTKHPATTLKEFRLAVAKSLLTGLGKPHEANEARANAGLLLGVPTTNIVAFGEAGDPAPGSGAMGHRLDGVGHFPDHVASVPKCCAAAGCKKRSMIWCTKCRRYLCLKKGVNCFWSYHNKPWYVFRTFSVIRIWYVFRTFSVIRICDNIRKSVTTYESLMT